MQDPQIEDKSTARSSVLGIYIYDRRSDLKNQPVGKPIEAFKTMVMLPISKSAAPTQIGQNVSFVESITFMAPGRRSFIAFRRRKHQENHSKHASNGRFRRRRRFWRQRCAWRDKNLVLGGFKSRLAPKIGDIDLGSDRCGWVKRASDMWKRNKNNRRKCRGKRL